MVTGLYKRIHLQETAAKVLLGTMTRTILHGTMEWPVEFRVALALLAWVDSHEQITAPSGYGADSGETLSIHGNTSQMNPQF